MVGVIEIPRVFDLCTHEYGCLTQVHTQKEEEEEEEQPVKPRE